MCVCVCVSVSNLEPTVATLCLSPCSHRAEFCCHAATQSHSIILRSIKRCGYPGRRESCLSFHSLFFSPRLLSFSSHNTLSLWLLSLPRLSILTSFPSASPSSLLHLFLLSLLLSSSLLFPPRGPSGDDEGAQYQGKSSQGVCSPLSFIFLCQSSGFVEHSTVTNIQWVKYPLWYTLSMSFQADPLTLCSSDRAMLFNVLHMAENLKVSDFFCNQQPKRRVFLRQNVPSPC